MRHQSEDLLSSDHKSNSLTLGGLSISHYGEVCKAYNLHGRSTRLNPCKCKEQCRYAAKSAGRFLGIRAQNGTALNVGPDMAVNLNNFGKITQAGVNVIERKMHNMHGNFR